MIIVWYIVLNTIGSLILLESFVTLLP